MLYALRINRTGELLAYVEGPSWLFRFTGNITMARKFSCPADAEAFLVSCGCDAAYWTLVPISAEGVAVAQDAMHDEFMRGRG